MENVKYNKDKSLPSNITFAKEDGRIVGYRVYIPGRITGKRIMKSFQNQSIPLETVLENAIKYRDEMLNAK